MEKQEFDLLVKEVGEQAAVKIKSATEELEKKYADQIKEAVKDNASKKELGELTEKFNEAQETIKKQALSLEQLQNMATEVNSQKADGAVKLIRKALTDNADKIASLKNSGSIKLDLKAADTIGTANFGAGVLQGLRLQQIERIDKNPFFILNLINVINGGVGSNPFSWVEMQNKEGAPAPVAENAAKPFVDFQWVENKATAEYIAGIVPINKQALNNMPMIENMVRTELLEQLQLQLQSQILTGDGNSPNLKGIKTYASAFAAGGLAGTIPGAQKKDALRAIVAQIYRNYGRASGILVHPDTVASIDTIKGANGHYVAAPFTSSDGTVISGVPIIECFEMGADEFLAGDFSKSMFNIVEDFTIEIGWINDQFQKNQLSIKAEIYGAHGIKAQHTNKFVTGTFADAIAAIDSAV